jgi:hypothetical protein
MRAQVYIDLFIVILLGSAFLALLTSVVRTIYQRIEALKIEEELELILQKTASSIIRFNELGEQNPLKPKPNETITLGVYNLALPERAAGKNYELYVISRSDLWANIRNFTSDELLSYDAEVPSAVLVARALEVEARLGLPNLKAELQGMYRSGDLPYLRYYRYDLDGRVYDGIVLSSYLVLHLEVMELGV